MRIVIPRTHGRGAGLGNELIPWGKAYIASQVLGISCGHPYWALNPRSYRKYFKTSRLDWIYNISLRALLPRYTLTQQEYLDTGEMKYADAVSKFSDKHGLKNKKFYCLEAEGMWGNFSMVDPARDFILQQLYKCLGVGENLFNTRNNLDKNKLWISFHIRLGDFFKLAPDKEIKGVFNHRIPLEWYGSIAKNLKDQFGDAIEFLLFSDGSEEELRPFMNDFSPWTTVHQNHTAVSDLLMMANCDLNVCSISSYSMWAAFLSDNPYIWNRDHLQDHGEKFSLWGHRPDQGVETRMTEANLQINCRNESSKISKGVPVGATGEIPDFLIKLLEDRLHLKSKHTDLLFFGTPLKA